MLNIFGSIHSIEVLLIEYLQCERVQIRKSLRFLYYHQLNICWSTVLQCHTINLSAIDCTTLLQLTTKDTGGTHLRESTSECHEWWTMSDWWMAHSHRGKQSLSNFIYRKVHFKHPEKCELNFNWICIIQLRERY